MTIYSYGFDYNLRAYTITEGVSCFFGINEEANIKNGGRITNTCYIETETGYVVIDSGPTNSYAQQAYTLMQKKRRLPIKYVINTSAHETKILGNKFYKERGATLIGPEVYRKLLKEKKVLNLSTQISKDAFVNTQLVPLDIYQNSNCKISIGDITLEIKKFESENTKQLVIFIPEKEIIFVGDYIYNREKYKVKNQNALLKFKSTICKIENLSWQYIISSKGTKIGRETITDTHSYINAILIPIRRNKRNKTRYRRERYRKKRAVIKFA
jgi:glyoxylase-like metal-dependent hydrolase (beta-lactamase superfamily II)